MIDQMSKESKKHKPPCQGVCYQFDTSLLPVHQLHQARRGDASGG